MLPVRWTIKICTLGMLAGAWNAAYGQQTYPVRPIRIVASAAGGGSDFVTRTIAQKVSLQVEQPVIVDNRGGGSIPGQIVATAPGDGYTLLYYGSTLWISPLMRDDVPYNVQRDFAPITLAVSSANIMVVTPSLPVNSVKEFIALAKAKPGVLNYGSAAAGTANHLSVELFKSMTGTDIVRIPHKGSGPAVISLLANQVQMMIAAEGGLAPHVKAGRLRALGVTSVKRSPLYPDLPAISESVPGYEYTSIWGIFAPGKTPKPIVDRLNREIVTALNSTDVKAKVNSAGIEVVAGTPEQLAAAVKQDVVRLGKVIKDNNIREQ